MASQSRAVVIFGDLVISGVLLCSLLRAFVLFKTGAYQTHLCHLTHFPPAIVAHEVDFENPQGHRQLTRERLDEYRQEFVRVRAARENIESIIFKY